jgi:hypothetical protein
LQLLHNQPNRLRGEGSAIDRLHTGDFDYQTRHRIPVGTSFHQRGDLDAIGPGAEVSRPGALDGSLFQAASRSGDTKSAYCVWISYDASGASSEADWSLFPKFSTKVRTSVSSALELTVAVTTGAAMVIVAVGADGMAGCEQATRATSINSMIVNCFIVNPFYQGMP